MCCDLTKVFPSDNFLFRTLTGWNLNPIPLETVGKKKNLKHLFSLKGFSPKNLHICSVVGAVFQLQRAEDREAGGHLLPARHQRQGQQETHPRPGQPNC